MTADLQRFLPSTSSRARRGFTIIELLVVIGVIGVLAALTTIGARRLTAGSRLAAGTNAVTNALGIARAAAIRDSLPTGVVFRPVWDPAKPSIPQRVEMAFVRSTGERLVFNATAPIPGSAERWLPVETLASIELPDGIKVAGPMYDPPGTFGSTPAEQVYATQIELPKMVNCSEAVDYARCVAVMFGADGQFLTRPPRGGLGDMKCFVDWDRDRAQEEDTGNCATGGNFEIFWLQDDVRDEPNLMFVPYLCVYDDKAARELSGGGWNNSTTMFNDLTGPNGYIAQYGDRISFNRFSGLPERKVR
ncbi:MAG: prepilin-type N-terminal cleavage/methylation domain-containing protein [Limnohabitans sp.]|nr:prepilin-type N-terminal cleavage/methylation domain-containing protein [Limnohabitans sp.]